MSKKIIMLIGTILGNCLVLALYNLWPDIPVDMAQWVVAGISSTGLGGVLGQGLADGMSRGLTSHQGKKILESQLEKNGPAPGDSAP